MSFPTPEPDASPSAYDPSASEASASGASAHPRAFSTVSAADLDASSPAELDALPYGVVGLAADGTAEIYNATESRLAGIPRSIVVGWQYFAETAQCMNNFMVAQRFDDEPEIDDEIDYVLTLRMRPTPVRLRLLKCPRTARRYLLIQR